MKILLIGFANLRYMPYLRFYLEQIDRSRHEVHVLYWNRDCAPEVHERDVIYHEFAYSMHDDIAKVKKLYAFGKFKRFSMELLRKNRFDFLIVMHSIPAFLLGNYICDEYRKRFIFDYRDYTYEFIPFFKRAIHRMVYASKATFVSSDAFRSALPAVEHIYTSHNILMDSLHHRAGHEGYPHTPIRISFWGYIRHPCTNEQIILRLADDPRFELHYYGREQEIALQLKAFVSERNIRNVFFHGAYQPEDRYAFSRETDLIHNIYGNKESPSQKNAVTNKYYDGLVFCIPQLCMKGSYMGDIAQRGGVGHICDPWSPDFADDIYDYYMSINRTQLRKCCDQALESVLNQYNAGREVVCHAIEPVDAGE